MDDRIEQLLSGRHYKRLQEQIYAGVIEKYQLSVLDVRVLLFLKTHGSNDTAKDIVKSHYFTKSNVSKSIDLLLDRGYLQKEYDRQDRRYIHLKVQPLACDVIREAEACQKQMRKIVFGGIEENEIRVVQKVAMKINQNIAEALRAEKGEKQRR